MTTKAFMKIPLMVLAIWSTPLLSWAEVTVQTTVDRNQMGPEDTLIAKVSVISTEDVEVTEPRVPTLEGFDLINSWTNRTQSTQLIQGPNGMEYESTVRQDFNYMLAPKKEGNVDIGAFDVVVDGKSYRTKPITIAVNEDFATGSNVAGTPADEEEDLLSQFMNRGGFSGGYTSTPPDTKNAFFLQVELDKTEAYEGEQILANWYIYTRGAVEQIDRLKFPNLKGFWKEDIEPSPSLNFTREIINGVPYKKALLASYALFPIKAGTAVVDEYKVKSQIRLPTSGFGAFGFGRAYSYTRSSETVKIDVKPLPQENVPKDFTGAVGQFAINSKIDGEKFSVNQPFSLKIRFEGQGNAKLIDLPPIELPPSVEVYDTKNEAKFFKTGRSYKEFEVLLIPREPGEVTIPAISTSIFDPVEKAYVTKSTQPVTLDIQPAQNGDVIPSQRLSEIESDDTKEAEKVLPGIIVNRGGGGQAMALPAEPAWALAFALAFGLLGFKARKEFEWGARKRNLKADVRARFKKVYQLLEKGEPRRASVEVTNIVYYTFGEVSGTGGANLEMNKLLLKAPPSVRRTLEPQLSQTVEHFQTLSFAPEELVRAQMEKKELKKMVAQMESLLTKAADLIEEKKENT